MKVVVFGATGVIGRAAVEYFSSLPDWEVVAVSRRRLDVPGVRHLALDLDDVDEVRRAARGPDLRHCTHIVYAALQEAPTLTAGWSDVDLMARNLRMFQNAIAPLARLESLEHVTLLQGAKAYGLHVGRTPLPAKESLPRDTHANFYFMQEDALRALADAASWSWTVLRPQVVFGDSIGSPMNLLPAIGVYATVERERGRDLAFPGGARAVHEAVDARLLAKALHWAAVSPAAHDEVFNVTNGDVFDWHEVWPTIAASFEMDVGEPEPQHLAETMPPRTHEWAAVVDRYALVSPREMSTFVGSSWQYADVLFGAFGTRPLPALLSTIKIRKAGFTECTDTDEMFRAWFHILRDRRLLPPL
jgi:nucleoside-diphosphate-sugar epimerase